MPLVKAQCTNCNGFLEVDNAKDAAICPHCGAPYIVEKAIQQFTINNTNIIQNATIINESEYLRLLEAGNGFLKLGNLNSASTSFKDITKKYPQKFEGWFGIVFCEIESKIASSDDHMMNLKYSSIALENATKLADTADKKERLNNALLKYENFARNHNSKLGSKFNSFKNDFQSLDEFIMMMVNGRIFFDGSVIEEKRNASGFSIRLEEVNSFPHEEKKSPNDPSRWKIRASEYGDGYAIFGVGTSYDSNTGIMEFGNAGTLTFIEKNDKGEYVVDFKFSYREGRAILKSQYDSNIAVASKGCYIATCVYGSYDCPEVWVLRRYRDYSLAENVWGRFFIKIYYAISPKLVRWLGDTRLFRCLWKGFLDRMVNYLKKKGIEDTQYYD